MTPEELRIDIARLRGWDITTLTEDVLDFGLVAWKGDYFLAIPNWPTKREDALDLCVEVLDELNACRQDSRGWWDLSFMDDCVMYVFRNENDTIVDEVDGGPPFGRDAIHMATLAHTALLRMEKK